MQRGNGPDGDPGGEHDARGPTIFAYVRDRPPPDGSGSNPFEEPLPDDPQHEPGKIGFAPGLVDRIGFDDNAEAAADRCYRALAAVARRPASSEAYDHFVDLVRANALPTFIDPFIARVAAAAALSRRRVHEIARRLATQGRDRMSVKVGIALLGFAGTASDLEVLMTLGRHAEFTSWVGASLANLLDDPEPSLWELAKTTQGWGQTAMIRQLTSTARPEIRSWILREGITFWTQEEVAYLAATNCHLVEELRVEEPDEPLWRGAGRILETLIECRQYRSHLDIDDYLDARESGPPLCPTRGARGAEPRHVSAPRDDRRLPRGPPSDVPHALRRSCEPTTAGQMERARPPRDRDLGPLDAPPTAMASTRRRVAAV